MECGRSKAVQVLNLGLKMLYLHLFNFLSLKPPGKQAQISLLDDHRYKILLPSCLHSQNQPESQETEKTNWPEAGSAYLRAIL